MPNEIRANHVWNLILFSILMTLSLVFLSPGWAFAERLLSVEMDHKKPNGKFWDVWGGRPDPYVIVDGHSYRAHRCQDQFKCTFKISETGRVQVIIVDADVSDDDYDAGSVHCNTGQRCQAKGASISIALGSFSRLSGLSEGGYSHRNSPSTKLSKKQIVKDLLVCAISSSYIELCHSLLGSFDVHPAAGASACEVLRQVVEKDASAIKAVEAALQNQLMDKLASSDLKTWLTILQMSTKFVQCLVDTKTGKAFIPPVLGAYLK